MGFVVMQIDFVISKAVYSSITEINDTGYITKIMMLANDSAIYNYIDKTNYFLYMPTFIFFYAAIACSNISLYRMPRNEMQMQVLRLTRQIQVDKSLRPWKEVNPFHRLINTSWNRSFTSSASLENM